MQQTGALQYGAHQTQASQHATPQQHPAARVNPERRTSVFDVPYQQAGMAAPPQQAGLGAQQQARDAGTFARFAHPAAAAATAGQQKGLALRPDMTNGKDEGLLDAADFPALGGGGGGGAAPLAQDITAGLASMRVNHAQLAKKLDGSDFPALSGAPGLGAPPNGVTGLPPPRQPGRPPAAQAGDLAAQAAWAAHLRQRAAEEDSGDDKYRLLDLLPLCPGHRRRDDWNDRQFLSVGIDVESLGLDLCQPDNVYPMLASPWTTGGSAGMVSMELPRCYLFDAPRLTDGAFERLNVNTLLFMFYAYAGDVRQIRAAVELEKRGWFWHRTAHQWWKKAQAEPAVTPSGVPALRGTFHAWDANAWRWLQHEAIMVERQVMEPLNFEALNGTPGAGADGR